MRRTSARRFSFSAEKKIDEAANERIDILMPQLMKAIGVTEELKAADPMKWMGLVNACRAQAEEIILEELSFDS